MTTFRLHELAESTLAAVKAHEENGGTFAVKVRVSDVKVLCKGFLDLEARLVKNEGGAK